ALGQAEAAGLVRFAAADPEPVYRFRHALIQEAAYDSLLKSDRRRLHREIGEALEARAPEEAEEQAAVLGLHFERAGEAERGVRYLHLAGRQALRRRAVAEAKDLLERATRLLDDAPETPEWERRRVEVAIDHVSAIVVGSPLEESLAIIDAARPRAERLGDERLIGLLLAREVGARSLRAMGRHVKRLKAVIAQALEIGERLDDPEIRALPQALYGMMLIREGRRREAVGVLEEAVGLLEQFVVNEASFYAGELTLALAQLGDIEAAKRTAARARTLADRSADPLAMTDADIFEAFVLGAQGRHEEATALAARAADTAGALGEPLCRAMACWVAGESQLAMERPGPAIEWLTEATDLASRNDGADVALVTGASLGIARAMSGVDQPTIAELDTLVEGARAAGEPMHLALVLMRRAQMSAMFIGDRQAAAADLAEAMDLFRRLETRPLLEQAERMATMLGAGTPAE
nr:hypothetical protein [Chloroflexota bacterium]